MTNNLEKLIDDLSKGAVKFKYTKKDGTVREAFGTTNINFIPSEHRPSEEASTVITDTPTVRYYDLNSKGWRSFIKENIL